MPRLNVNAMWNNAVDFIFAPAGTQAPTADFNELVDKPRTRSGKEYVTEAKASELGLRKKFGELFDVYFRIDDSFAANSIAILDEVTYLTNDVLTQQYGYRSYAQQVDQRNAYMSAYVTVT